MCRYGLGRDLSSLSGRRTIAVTCRSRYNASFRMAEPTNPLAPIKAIVFIISVD